MTPRAKAIVLFLYSLAVIASGCVRYFASEGGEKGLWFGLVMGALGIVASLLVAKGRVRAGMALGILTLAFVGGWFTYESFVKKGVANAESRQLIMIGMTIGVALGFVFARQRGSGRGAQVS